MIAFRITLSSDNSPTQCLGYRAQLKTSQILAKEYMKDHGAIQEVWKPNEGYVQFLVPELLEKEIVYRIIFEEINIEY